MNRQPTWRPRVNISLQYEGRRTLRGRLGFALMRLGACLASRPLEFRPSKEEK